MREKLSDATGTEIQADKAVVAPEYRRCPAGKARRSLLENYVNKVNNVITTWRERSQQNPVKHPQSSPTLLSNSHLNTGDFQRARRDAAYLIIMTTRLAGRSPIVPNIALDSSTVIATCSYVSGFGKPEIENQKSKLKAPNR